jgi:hypothetical protein
MTTLHKIISWMALGVSPVCITTGVAYLLAAAGVDWPLIDSHNLSGKLLIGIPALFCGLYAFWQGRRANRHDPDAYENQRREAITQIRQRAFGEQKIL